MYFSTLETIFETPSGSFSVPEQSVASRRSGKSASNNNSNNKNKKKNRRPVSETGSLDPSAFWDEGSGGVNGYNDDDDSLGYYDNEEFPIQKQKQRADSLAARESKAVFLLRLILLLLLVASAVAVVIGVHLYLQNGETKKFKAQFYSDANKVLDSLGNGLDATVAATDAFAARLVSFAKYSNSTYPFVTMPDFAIQATKLLRLSKAFHISFCPIVLPHQKEAWEDYSNNNTAWIDNGIDVQSNDPDYRGSLNREYTPSKVIYGLDGNPLNSTGPFMDNYLPGWQQSPVILRDRFPLYNFDEWELPAIADGLLHSFQHQQFVIGNFGNVIFHPDDPDHVASVEASQYWVSTFNLPNFDVSQEPTGVMAYPVLDTIIDSVRVDTSAENQANNNIVGALVYVMAWKELISNILPEKSVGIVAVFSHACDESFTYQIDGPSATFLGLGDQHDRDFDDDDDYSFSALLPDLIVEAADGGYSGLPLSTEFCPIKVTIYPSKTMERKHRTREPIFFPLVGAGIFLFTSLVFLTYDALVRRRQRIVKDEALTSTAIVSSLYPEKVKQQLLREHTKSLQSDAPKQGTTSQSQQRGVEMAANAVDDSDEDSNSHNIQQQLQLQDEQDNAAVSSGPSIAELYHDTTIFFADISGFTKWSATREPAEVFELLETLYATFDDIAKKRRVFKVETIGDCYLAVTGIPEPQEDHAVIMSRFAFDCMTQMDQLKNGILQQTLGPDVHSLQLRVGMHSGAVTAGVLRGQKSRFQLFGDSVNTASRIECTGQAGRIHASAETANALRLRGKTSWIMPRQDKIVAKGKGELQTFWINVRGGGTTTGSSVQSSSDDNNSEDGSHNREEVKEG